ncbi:MAG: hypothetical protein LBR62_00610 [Puniceicoccales bacterium]|nr:hypothetical protein [Puniceicoccales bacterium]
MNRIRTLAVVSLLAGPLFSADGPVGSLTFPMLCGNHICDNYGVMRDKDPIFDRTGLAESDFRQRNDIAGKLPILFHYRAGGTDSARTFLKEIFRITSPLSPAIAAVLGSEGVNPTTVPVYYLKTTLIYPLFNWFTQPCFMTEMPTVGTPLPTIIINVKSGIFEGRNLMAVENQMGINTLVLQTLSFHDGKYLSGNVANVSLIDPSQPASGCFVSICDGRAIVVYVDFVPEETEDL